MNPAGDWKKTVADLLQNVGLVDPQMTGKLIINYNQGGISSVEKTIILK